MLCIETPKMMVLPIMMTCCWLASASAGLPSNVTSSSASMLTSRYDMHGEEFVDNVMQLGRALHVVEGCVRWPLTATVARPELLARDLGNVTVLAMRRDGARTTRTTFSNFTADHRYEVFDADVSEVAAIRSQLRAPLFLASCRPLLDHVSMSASVHLVGAKPGLTMMRKCTENSHRIFAFFGDIDVAMRVAASRDSSNWVKLNPAKGSVVFLPRGLCYAIRANDTSGGRFVVGVVKWRATSDEKYNCSRKSVYDFSSHLKLDESARQRMRDNTIANFELVTGHQMPPIGLGTSRLFEKTYDTVRRALDIGYRLIDTAQQYSGQVLDVKLLSDDRLYGCDAAEYGAFDIFSESEIGRAIADSTVDRSDLFISSKLMVGCADPIGVRSAIDASLRRLRTDYLDSMIVHDFDVPHESCWPDSGLPPHTSCKTGPWEQWLQLEAAYLRGQVRSLGVSNIIASELRRLVKLASQPVALVQNWFDPFHQDKEVRQICKQHNITYMGYSTLGYIWIDDLSFGFGHTLQNPVMSNQKLIDAAILSDTSVTSVVLRWAMTRGVAVIPCTTTPVHLKMNFYARERYIQERTFHNVDKLDGTIFLAEQFRAASVRKEEGVYAQKDPEEKIYPQQEQKEEELRKQDDVYTHQLHVQEPQYNSVVAQKDLKSEL